MSKASIFFWPTATTANLMAIFSILAVILALGTKPIPTSSLLLVMLLVTGYTWLGVLAIAKLGQPRFSNSTVAAVLLATGILILGSTRGWLFSEVNSWFEIADPASLEQRVLNSTISTLVWALAILSIEFRLRRYRAAFREKLLLKANELGSGYNQEHGSHLELPGGEDLTKLQANLRLIASDLKGQSKSNDALPIAAREIQSQVSELLRPLSHRIWFNAEKNRPQFHLSGLLTQALRTLRINWWLTVLVGAGIFFLGASSLLSPQESLLRTMGYAVFLSLSLLLLSRVPKRPKNPLLSLVVLVVIASGTILTSELVASAVLYGQNTSSYPIVAIAGPVSTLALLILAAVLGQLDEDWKLIDSMLESSDFSLGHSASDYRFASFLHNSLQSELNGIALTLSRLPDPEAPQVSKLLERLDQISNESIAQRYIKSQSRDFSYLQRLVEAWEPLIAIELDTSTEVADHPRFALLVELLEESISNAVRHAAAKAVSIDVLLIDDDILVTIAHPAATSASQSKQLGAGWLGGYAKSHDISWQRGMRTLKVVM